MATANDVAKLAATVAKLAEALAAQESAQPARARTAEAHSILMPKITDAADIEPRNLLTVEAAAKRLSIGRTTMYALIKAGHIATVRIGHLRRIPTAAIAAYLDQLTAMQAA